MPWMHVRMHVRMHAWMHARLCAAMDAWMHVRTVLVVGRLRVSRRNDPAHDASEH